MLKQMPLPAKLLCGVSAVIISQYVFNWVPEFFKPSFLGTVICVVGIAIGISLKPTAKHLSKIKPIQKNSPPVKKVVKHTLKYPDSHYRSRTYSFEPLFLQPHSPQDTHPDIIFPQDLFSSN